jgi:protein-disulfide isomerase
VARPVKRPTPAKKPAKRAKRPAVDNKGWIPSYAPSYGPKQAKVTIVTFSDFECPFCARGAQVLDQIKKAYKNKVHIVFRHFPLSFHPNAHLAGQASLAANAQGKFWAYHDKLFANQENLTKADLLKYAKQLKLDMAKFKQALDKGTYKKQVDADFAFGNKIAKVQGTPYFSLRTAKYTRVVEGAYPLSHFRPILDALLAGKKPPPKPADSDDSGDQDQQGQQPPAKPKGPVTINLKGAPSFGPAKAKVTIVEFSDFECPYCSEGASLMNRLKKAFGKKVRFVFKHLPLPFHKDAHLAAQASMAAHAQGKFWAYHDKLFANQKNLKKSDLLKYAKQLKLDVSKFKQALDKGTYKKYVDADFAEARKIRVGGTPTFYVNGVELTDTPSFEAFKAMLEKALKAKPKPRPRPRAKVPAKRRPAPPRAR